MSYTPGPWKLRVLGPAKHYAIESAGGEMIATTTVNHRTREDAYLIAAAPAMLTALKAILTLDELDMGDDSLLPADHPKAMVYAAIEAATEVGQ